MLKNELISQIEKKLDLQNSWIAGSAALSKFQYDNYDHAADIDIFFNSSKNFHDFSHYVDDIGCSEYSTLDEDEGAEFYGQCEYREFVLEDSDEVINLNLVNFNHYPTPYTHICNFDITVAAIATDGERFVMTPNTLRDITTKTLNFTNSWYEEKTNEQKKKTIKNRVVKYSDYGFKLSSETMKNVMKYG